MQTLDQFIARNTGKKLDYDGIWPGQCVDGARCYLRDCFGVSFEPPPMPGADDWAKPMPHLTWVKNAVGNASQYPRPGDIVVWGQNSGIGTGPFGHIAVFVAGNGLAFNGFEQNWPIGAPMHIQHHPSYAGVLGWLRPVPLPLPVPVPKPTPAPPPEPSQPLPAPLPKPNPLPEPPDEPAPGLQDLLLLLLGFLRKLLGRK